MNNKIDDLYDRLIKKNKYVFLRNFLENNKNQIIKSIKDKVSYKNIYIEFKEMCNLDIKYTRFCQILSDFKMKYIYNAELKDMTQKEKKEKVKTELQVLEQKAPATEFEKIETKKYVPADETQNNNTNSAEPQKLPRIERLLAIKNRKDDEKIIDVQKDQEKFVWTPSIKK